MNISQRLSLVAVTLVLGSAALLGQEQNETLLQIDDQIISSADVEKKAHQLLTANPELDPEQLTTISLKDLVHASLFRRAAQQLQIPLAIFEQFINDHIAREVERAGSYHEFLEDQKLKLGIENMDDYKLYVLNDFIRAEVLNILLGKNPTTNKGFLAIIEPTPAEVRQAFKENEAYRTIPATSSWSFLKFSRTIGSDSAQQRAEDAVAAFNAKEISYSELIKQADLEIQRQGYTQDSAPWVIEFVSNAKSGDVLMRPPSSSGDVSVLIATEVEAEREIGFKEAQVIIRKDLMSKKRNAIIDKFFTDTARSVDIWVNPDIPGLERFVETLIGIDIYSNSSEEL